MKNINIKMKNMCKACVQRVKDIETDNKWYLVITFFSLLSIIPLSFFIKNVIDLKRISDLATTNDKMINDVLGRTISEPFILAPLIIGFFVWAINGVISAVALNKSGIKKSFSYLTLILGGIGLHAIYLLFIHFRKMKRTFQKIGYVAPGVALAITAAVAIPAWLPSFDDAVQGDTIVYSTNPESPNLLEIFTDGFDQWNYDDLTNTPVSDDESENLYKDFNWFPYFETPSPLTHRSVPAMYGGFQKWNPFQIRKDHNLSAWDLSIEVYKNSFLKSGIEHFQRNKDSFGQRSIVNPITLSDNTLYGAASSGTPRAISKLDPDLNITNWSGARDYNAGKFGITEGSPDIDSYKYLSANSIASKEPDAKGARIYIADLLTHRPFVTKNGKLNSFDTSKEDARHEMLTAVSNVIRDLKTKGAYDNTMIVVWGDHSSHDRDFGWDKDVNHDKNWRKSESAMMIKYPNKTYKSMNVVDDKVVFGASLNYLIDGYFSNDSSKYADPTFNPMDFYNNPEFDLGIERPAFIDDNYFVPIKWEATGTDDEESHVGEWEPSAPESKLQIHRQHITAADGDANGDGFIEYNEYYDPTNHGKYSDYSKYLENVVYASNAYIDKNKEVN